MDIFTFSQGLEQQLKALADSRGNDDLLTHTSKMMAMSQELMHDLQQFTCNYSFPSPADEIRFFKEVKPVLFSQYFYYKKIFDIALFDSFKEPHARKLYYENVLAGLEEFARDHQEFYLYCMTGQTTLDELYFLRKKRLFSEFSDTRFSTGYDDKLARLLANELIRKHVFALIIAVDTPPAATTWTGNKTDAIELLFALHASGAINNGEIDLRKLAQRFEEFFNIQLGSYYDFLKNIRTRKGGRANFIDRLKNKLLQRLDKMDG